MSQRTEKTRFSKVASLWKAQKGYVGQLDPVVAHLLGTDRVMVRANDRKDGQNQPDIEIVLIYGDNQEEKRDERKDDLPF